MKIGDQRPPARQMSPSISTQHSAPRNHHATEGHPHGEDVSAPRRTSPAPAGSQDATAQPEAPRASFPQAPEDHGFPFVPDEESRRYIPDSPTAIMRHINTAYPPIIHYTLHIGMLVKDLHEKIGECHAWCEAAVEAGMGGEPAVRETLAALERLRFVVPRGVGANWIGVERV
ncbi:hypothetical protein PSPO01_07704 [Paraphaeosphaeria sporulosa]